MAKRFRRRPLAQRTVALERFRLLPVLREPDRAISRSGINALHWELRKLHHYSDRQPYQETANNSQPSRFGITGNCGEDAGRPARSRWWKSTAMKRCEPHRPRAVRACSRDHERSVGRGLR
jgi:hypothetical protein